MSVLLVVLGAAVGAPLRYLVDRAVQERLRGAFPFGTLAVNVAGSLVLGVVTGGVALGAPVAEQTLVGTGFCGALTTFSTFSYETLRLLETNARLAAAANLVGSVVGGLGAALLGVEIARAVLG